MTEAQDLPIRRHADDGARAALANARRLLEASHVLAQNDNFGVAISLAILSGEESIKAVALFAWAADLPIPTEKHLRAILRKHEPRHDAAVMLFGAGEIVGSVLAALLAALNRSPTAKGRDQDLVQLSRVAWWANANDLKNRGFYVEFERPGWKTPSDLPKTEFTRAYEEANAILTFADQLLSASSEPATR